MIKRVLFSLALISLAISAPAYAGSLEFSLNDFSAQAALKQKVSEDDFGASLVNARVLYNSREDTILGSMGLDVLGNIGMQGIRAGAGVKLYGGESDDEDLLSLALGVMLRVAPASWQGFGVSGSFFYGPSVLSAFDCDGLIEGGVSVDYEFIPRARVFIGYNNIRLDIDDRGKKPADEAVRVGVELSF